MTKKTFFITLGFIMLTYFSASSQNFKFGFVAGLDVAKSHITNIPEGYGEGTTYKPMMTYNFNGYIGYKKYTSWGISLEPGFIQKGERQNFLETKNRFNLNYIHMPILFDYYVNDKIYFSIGPEFGYLLSAKFKSKETSFDITNSYSNRFELSGLVGLNYKISDNIDVGFRYNHGLTEQFQIEWTDAQGNNVGKSNVYNQYYQLVVKYKL